MCPKPPSPSMVSGPSAPNANQAAEDILSFEQCEEYNQHHYYRGPNNEVDKVWVVDLGCQARNKKRHNCAQKHVCFLSRFWCPRSMFATAAMVSGMIVAPRTFRWRFPLTRDHGQCCWKIRYLMLEAQPCVIYPQLPSTSVLCTLGGTSGSPPRPDTACAWLYISLTLRYTSE